MQMVLAFEAEREAEVAALTDADEQRKSKGRERWRRWKENNRANVSQHLPTTANDSRGGVTRVEDKTSNSKIEPQKENKKREPALAEFEDWYSGYPHKVQRGAAERAFVKARSVVSLDTLKAGVRAYIASKPADRHWQNPATWLNGKGWLDQPANVVPMARPPPALRMDDFLGAVIEQQERQNAGPDQKVEGHSSFVRAIPRAGWST